MRPIMTSTAAAVVVLAGATAACGQAAERRFDIAPGPLGPALVAFADQSGVQILYDADVVASRWSPGVAGTLRPEDALARLLRGTGLAHRETADGAVVISQPIEAATSDGAQVTQLSEIVVTGSLLRGVAAGPSPVVTFDRDQIDRDGHATVAQAIAALPQNFGGGANEAALGNGGDRSGVNSSYANGVNLRGLGSDATLVLVNGRRVAGSGAKGDFTDLSSIPTAAIERVDVLLDGASALYGADAVGGVVNIILRRELDGAETRLRLGSTDDGASADHQLGQTVGRRWVGGGAFAAYEYYDREALPVSARRLAGDADLRDLGGSDWRSFYANPGNLVRFDPSAGGYVVTHAIPADQDGSALEPSDFIAGRTNLSNNRQGMVVLPRQTRHSLYGAAHHRLTPRLELSGDLRWTRRDYKTRQFPITTLLTVSSANPFFASPTGAASHTIAYSFAGQLDNPLSRGEIETLAGTAGLDLDLGSDWRLNAYVAEGRETADDRTDGSLQSTFLREALGAVADDPATHFQTARDGFFNPFGAGAFNGPAVLDFISAGWTTRNGETGVRSADVRIDGPLLTLPGGALRLAAGLSAREETFQRQVTSFTSGSAPSIGEAAESRREVWAAYAEARVPLFGPDNRRAGLERLEVSLAARFEDYRDVGQTTSPKIGLLWSPADRLILRANYGRSFRAPGLVELNDPASASPSILPRGGQQVLSMILYGGNPELDPEEADTWTAGGEWRPAALPGLRLSANLFRTDFTDRIGQPAFENVLTALSDPSIAPFVRLIDPVTNDEDRDAIQAILDRPTTNLRDLFGPEAYGAIVDARFVNTARVEVRGADLGASYGFDLGDHAFDFASSLTWLERFDSQSTPTSPVVSLVDRPNFPVGLRGRGSLAWSRGDLGASAAVAYIDSYEDLEGASIDAWTTVDLQLRYTPAQLDGLTVAFNLQNAFEADPPFYDAPQGVGYDAANHNVLGRYISLQITKAW